MTSPYPANPNWPATWGKCTVVGQYLDSTGTPMPGQIVFTPAPPVVIVGTIMIMPAPLTAYLDTAGRLSVDIPASDDPDINPGGWTYAVDEQVTAGRKYNIAAPLGTVVDLSVVSPVTSFTGNVAPPGQPVRAFPVSAITSWTQSHSFPYPPGVRLVASDGSTVTPSAVSYPSAGSVTATTTAAFTGTIYLF